MEGLAKEHEVTLFSFYNDPSQLSYIKKAKEICKDVHLEYRKEGYSRLDLFKGLLSTTPFSIFNYWSAKAHAAISELVEYGNFDVIQVEHMVLAQYAENLTKVVKVLDFHNLEYEKMERYASLQKSFLRKRYAHLTSKKLKSYEFEILDKFNLCLTCSEREKRILTETKPGAIVQTVPNGADILRHSTVNGNKTEPVKYLLFIGALNADKNVDAVRYFAHDIFPLLKTTNPGLIFRIVGGPVPAEIATLNNDPSIEVLGYVGNLAEVLNSATLSLVPLRYGGGTRLKILESLAHSVPVVSSSIGCEGIDVLHGRDILIADSPRGFASELTRLINSTALRQKLIRNGLDLIREKYDWQMIVRALSESIIRIAQSAPRVADA